VRTRSLNIESNGKETAKSNGKETAKSSGEETAKSNGKETAKSSGEEIETLLSSQMVRLGCRKFWWDAFQRSQKFCCRLTSES